jgi:adenylosuccinate lyase
MTSNDIKTNTHSILVKTALNMLKQKLDDKLISSVTGLSLEEISKLKNKL